VCEKRKEKIDIRVKFQRIRVTRIFKSFVLNISRNSFYDERIKENKKEF